AALAVLPAAAGAQEIAIVKSEDLRAYTQVVTGFSIETRVAITEYNIARDPDRGVKIFELIKARKPAPALVLAVGPTAANMARKQIKDIPIVFCMVPNHEKYGLDAPNVTGISLLLPLKVQLATLKTLVPNLHSVGVMYNPKYNRDVISGALAAAKSLGLTLVPAKVDEPDDVQAAAQAFLDKIDAILLIADRTVSTPQAFRVLLEFANRNRVPMFSPSEEMVREGALVSITPDFASIGHQAGKLANEIIFRRRQPSTLPVAPPEGLEIAINLSTAKRIGVECNIALEVFTFAARQSYRIKVFE
ncbi:MAG: ABC transporter substrate-binding protein, partial [Pseudomonadota bacterium]